MAHFLIYVFPLDKVIHLLRPKVFLLGIIIFILLKDHSVSRHYPKKRGCLIKLLFLFTIKFLDQGVRKKTTNRLGKGKGCIFSIATTLQYKVRVITFFLTRGHGFCLFQRERNISWTHNLSMCPDQELNPQPFFFFFNLQPFDLQDDAPTY